jgi:hypothetical protein
MLDRNRGRIKLAGVETDLFRWPLGKAERFAGGVGARAIPGNPPRCGLLPSLGEVRFVLTFPGISSCLKINLFRNHESTPHTPGT